MIETSTIVYFLINFGYLGVFIGIIFGGEILLIIAGVLASFGYLKPSWLIFFALLGIIFHDIIWYLLGRSGRKLNFIKNIGKKIIKKTKFYHLENKFKKYSIKTIFFLRFIYGFRAFVLLAAGFSKMNLLKFILIDSLGSLFWAIISIFLGYFFGHSFFILKEIIKEINIFLLLVFSFCIIFIFLIYLIKKWLVKKIN